MPAVLSRRLSMVIKPDRCVNWLIDVWKAMFQEAFLTLYDICISVFMTPVSGHYVNINQSIE